MKKTKSIPSKPISRGVQVLVILVTLVISAIVMVLVLSDGDPYKAISAEVNKGMAGTDVTISLAEFEAIKNGMTYDEVCDIVGGEGILLAESGSPGDEYYTVIYQWTGEGTIGANANFTFTGQTLETKAQFGLK